MRKSARVTLVLIGLTTLAGCGGEEKRRDVYRTREDCLADWGNKPEDCTPATEKRHAGTGFWYGPMYLPRWGGSWFSRGSGASSTRMGSGRSIGSSSSGVSRGGFGSSGRSSAS
ncbi:MAG TPA: hypothetical protein VEC19_00330 [Usitatibacter sp.]|nr:hypothetical protein [Usitatibacter sp.]